MADVKSREIVLNILLEVTEGKATLSAALSGWLRKYQYLDKRARAFISRLVRVTIEHMIFIDAVIGRYASVPVPRMKPVVRAILRMGVAQMLYMDGVPDHAVCSESVNLAVRRGFRGLKGFVNGVLRAVAGNRDQLGTLIPDREKDPEQYLSLRYSAPLWLCRLWISAYGMTAAEAMLGAAAEEGATTVRVNTLKTTPQALARELLTQGISVTSGDFLPFVLKISGYDHLAALDAFRKGEMTVQDESSVLAGVCAGLKPGMRVMDVCGAPGGKSINAALLMGGEGEIVCRDLSETKVARIQENISRMDLSCVHPQVWDALCPDPEMDGWADVVIADVPCSGLGVMGKKPDIKYRMTPENIEALVGLQRQIIDASWRYVKPGGVLLYSTCTLNPAENEAQVRYMTERYPLKVEPVLGLQTPEAAGKATRKLKVAESLGECQGHETCEDTMAPETAEKWQNAVTGEGFLQLMPGIHPCDGFFAAKLRRVRQE